MGRYVEGEYRTQSALLPEQLDDWIHEDSTVRVIDVFVDELDLRKLGFDRADPASTGRPAYNPAMLLKIYVYGYLNRVQSSRRLETEAQRNLELIWLTARLAPDFKTIADFRRDNGDAIRKVCKEFVLLCRRLKLFTDCVVAIDGSKFWATGARFGRTPLATELLRTCRLSEPGFGHSRTLLEGRFAASHLMSWARLLKRVFEIDLEHCPNRGGELKIIAAILEQPVIEKILAHLGLQARTPPRAPARGQALRAARAQSTHQRWSGQVLRAAGTSCVRCFQDRAESA